ncbi:AGE family epimerase/isomerase [Nocardiopsis sp. HNM0947]|uniref:AGE family epimerase/isomerase n=1 Tax=Nocardiopsis coralli TaxID=2772213 RepID=A0ABR9P527_9ACTN|nr:AGE family epimerase/isomerase [Nocardiopsis coralli]MBE2998957.1 AGE family epimerase/isomerase [Nocardiopsis coralli]
MIDRAAHRSLLEQEYRALLPFGSRIVHPDGGAAYLDSAGAPDLERPVYTWITARTVHVYSLGLLSGAPEARRIAEGALAGLTDRLHDPVHGGWFHAVGADGAPFVEEGKSAYDHAFVMLAASSATRAGLPEAQRLLQEATTVFLERFWSSESGRSVDHWDRTWTHLDPYRGLNANMHAVEAMLAVADTLGEPVWRERARRVVEFVSDLAAEHDARLPEHFDENWCVRLDLNRDHPDDPFKPFGATVGHGFEWARLLVELAAASGIDPGKTPVVLFDRAVADGWHVDGAPGFVYTTDWEGRPVVRDRMHWVAAEALSAASALYRVTGEPRFAKHYGTWWEYICAYFVDRDHGSWHHQLDPSNRPASDVWPGKPDLYHAVQATLLPRAPLTPSLATAVAEGKVIG